MYDVRHFFLMLKEHKIRVNLHVVHLTALVCQKLYYFYVATLNQEEMVVLQVYQVGLSVL